MVRAVTSPRARASTEGHVERPVEARRARRFGPAVLTEVARAVASRRSAVEVAQVVAEAAWRALPAERVEVWLTEPGRGDLGLLVMAGPPAAGGEPSSRDGARVDGHGALPVTPGVGAARPSGVRGPGCPASPRAGGRAAQAAAPAPLLVPVLAGGTPLGVLVAVPPAHVTYTAMHGRRLEQLAVQLAAGLEGVRLRAEALRELAQLKAEFLRTVSHELRTPLSLIHGYAELLLHRADCLSPAEVRQMSREIHTGSRTLIRLVDDLLDFTQLAHGQLQLHRQRLALSPFLGGLARSFAGQPGGERIVTDLAPGLGVDADPERLRQIVGNLLANALAYTTDGPIVLRGRPASGGVRVEVADQGPGLTAEEVGRIWESFYRGAEPTHLPNRGSGLGLAVVKRLVELHGGEVGVESAPGHGTTFWFSLPAPAPADATTGAARAREATQAATPAAAQASGSGSAAGVQLTSPS